MVPQIHEFGVHLELIKMLIFQWLYMCNYSTYWITEDEGPLSGFGADADAHPLVSFTINLI